MRIHRRGQSALASFAVALVATVSLAPATATAEPTPRPATTASASSTPAPSPNVEADPTSTAAPAPSPVTAQAAAADTVPPVLTGVSVSPTAVEPGDSLTISYTFTDDSPLWGASFSFTSNGLFQVFTDTVAPVGGSHQVTIPTDAIDGQYVLTSVRLKDSAGNDAEFRADGTVVGRPNPPASGTHSVDFSKVSYTVSGSTRDVEPPVLTSLSMVRAGVYVGDLTTLAYEVTDKTVPLQSISIAFANETTQTSHAAMATDASAAGTVSVDPTLSAGVNRLDSVTIYDGRGLWSIYRRDGSVSGTFGGNGTHGIDFSKLDVTTLPAAPAVTARSMPRGIWLQWPLLADERAALSGYRVTVSPRGSTVTVPASAGELQTRAITGLTNGTAYTVSVTALSPWGDGKTFTTTVTPMPSRNIFGSIDVTGDRKADVIAHRRRAMVHETAYLYPGNGSGGFGKSSAYEQTLGDDVAPGGDTDTDGRGDLLIVRAGSLEVRHSWGYRTLGRGWGTMRFIDGGADFSGDRRTDILAVTRAGELYLYRLGSDDRITSSSKLGSGWGSMHAFFTPGDFSGDGKADIVAMDAAGDLWLYRGTGTGGFLSRLKIGVGWAGFGAVLPMRDFNGDGRADIGAVTMSGDLLLYPGNGRSGFYSPKKIGTGWHAFF